MDTPRFRKPLDQMSPAYRRRIERLLAEGFTLSQARGHARKSKGEQPVLEVRGGKPLRRPPKKPKPYREMKAGWKARDFKDPIDAWKYLQRLGNRFEIIVVIHGRPRLNAPPREEGKSPSLVPSLEELQAMQVPKGRRCGKPIWETIITRSDYSAIKAEFGNEYLFENWLNVNYCDIYDISVRFRKIP